MATILKPEFFNRQADVVARELLNAELCILRRRRVTRYRITETEAYMGPHDLACHSAKGRTKRTEVMYSAAGTIYVYLIYGIYEMLNVVTGEAGYPAAVLIRGVEGYDGPGKLTKALNIDRQLNGRPLGRRTGVWIEAAPTDVSERITCTPRIGVAYAKEWAEEPLRFVLTPGDSYFDRRG